MKKIILGVHGLGNKPPKKLLEKWWRRSIIEGLQRIGRPHLNFDFKLIYWADFLHTTPLDPDETDEDSDLYIEERYKPAVSIKKQKQKSFKERFLNFFKKQRDKILFNESMHLKFPSLTDLIIKKFFRDLDIYFSKHSDEETEANHFAKDLINKKLIDTLSQYQERDILIIAHSMGSIIMYDTLMRVGNDFDVGTVVTVGSPLGVPFILQKLKADLSSVVTDVKNLYTPDCISREWINLADIDDKLAQSADLGKMFKPNKKGVKPNMLMVDNDYENNGIENPHKSYGYLRAYELSFIIDEFLCRDEIKFFKWLSKKFNQVRLKLTGSLRRED